MQIMAGFLRKLDDCSQRMSLDSSFLHRSPPCVMSLWQVVHSPALLASMTAADTRLRREAWHSLLHALGGEHRHLASIPDSLASDMANMSV